MDNQMPSKSTPGKNVKDLLPKVEKAKARLKTAVGQRSEEKRESCLMILGRSWTGNISMPKAKCYDRISEIGNLYPYLGAFEEGRKNVRISPLTGKNINAIFLRNHTQGGSCHAFINSCHPAR